MTMALRLAAALAAIAALTNCTQSQGDTTHKWTAHVIQNGCAYYALQGDVDYVIKFETWVPSNPNTQIFDGENISSKTDLTLGLAATLHDDSNGYDMAVTPIYKASDYGPVKESAAFHCGGSN